MSTNRKLIIKKCIKHPKIHYTIIKNELTLYVLILKTSKICKVKKGTSVIFLKRIHTFANV